MEHLRALKTEHELQDVVKQQLLKAYELKCQVRLLGFCMEPSDSFACQHHSLHVVLLARCITSCSLRCYLWLKIPTLEAAAITHTKCKCRLEMLHAQRCQHALSRPHMHLAHGDMLCCNYNTYAVPACRHPSHSNGSSWISSCSSWSKPS